MKHLYGIVGFALSLMTTASAQAPAPTLSPTQLYFVALQHMRGLSAPPYIEYDVQATFVQHKKYADHWNNHIVERNADHTVWESEDPKDDGQHLPPQVYKPGWSVYPFSPVRPSSNSSQNTPVFDDATTGAAVLKSIATVRAVSPRYRIMLLGHQDLANCANSYHLRLEPIRDPQKNNVRGLWVDPTDYQICQVDFRGLLAFGPFRRDIPLTVVLDSSGREVNAFSRGTVRLALLPFTYSYESRYLNFATPSQEPAYYFDRTLWQAHIQSTSSATPRP